MEGTAAHYSSDLKIKDARFSIDYLQDYSLLLQAGENEFGLAVIDTKSGRCLLLEHYTFHAISNKTEYQRLLKALFEEHHLLMAGFWHSVKLSVKNNHFSLIPTALFDPEQLALYLRLTSAPENSETLLYYRHPKHKLVNVFAAEQELVQWLQQRYANLKIKVLHHLSPFIEGILQLPLNPEPALFLLLESNTLSVVISKQGKVEYANLFRCATPADMLRYLMMVVKQFGLSQRSTPVLIWGSISINSAWYREIKPYFSQLSIGRRPPFLSFSYGFDEVQEQQFFDLFSQYICE